MHSEALQEKSVPVEPRFGSVADMATHSGLSQGTIRNLIRSRALRSFKIGRRVLVTYAELDLYIGSQVQ